MNLRNAVRNTIKYADFFDFPLFPDEIHYWLITSRKVSLKSLKNFLPSNLSPSQIKFRSQVSQSTSQKTELAQKLVRILKYVPGLQMIGLTGSVAAGNAREHDDIDLCFITSAHTLWLVRPVVIFLISLFFRRRHPGEDHSQATNAFCPNLWMDTLSVSVPIGKRSLYTAHEVLQVKPLHDRGDTYQYFLRQNGWVKKYLANSFAAQISANERRDTWDFSIIFSPFNFVSYLLQTAYMHPKKTTEKVDLHAAYLHTTDFDTQINQHLETQEV